MHVNSIARLAVASMFALTLGEAQALRLDVVGGSASGTADAEIVSGAAIADSSTDLATQVSPGTVAASDGASAQALPFQGGTLAYGWNREGYIENTGRPDTVSLWAGGNSTLQLDGVDPVSSFFESTRIDLVGDLLISSATDAVGTPVSVTLSGQASSSFSTTLTGVDHLVTFQVDVLDGNDALVASYMGIDAGSTEPFSIVFQSRVGDHLTVDFRYGTDSILFAEVAGTGSVDSASLLEADLRVAAVPEPGTWALIAGGLLSVGAVARRRSSK